MGYEVKLDHLTIVSYYRRFLMIGFTPIEAGNLVASLLGLRPSKSGWSIKQLKALMFLVDLSGHAKI